MDAKASAKSKRAHSLQAKRAHSNPNPKKNPIPSQSINTKKSLNQNTNKTHQSHLLPSNWDRYDEDEEIDSNNPQISSVEIVEPKSKGADFNELISQAQIHARARSNPNPDCFASVDDDDVFPYFYQGVSTMLSVKENILLSWSADDSFIIDDGATSSFEASFLSMDLHALATQLEKIDVSQRLFIERDLLPEELCEQSKESNILGSGHGKMSQATSTRKNADNDNELEPFTSSSRKNSDVHSHHHTKQAASERSSFPTFAGQSAKPHHLVADSKLFQQNGVGEVLESILQLSVSADLEKETLKTDAAAAEAELDMLLNTIVETKENKSLGFEATTAEAELDMLLDSFGETELLNSVDKGVEPSNGFPTAQYESSTTFLKHPSTCLSTQPIKQVHDSSKHASLTNALDDVLDDLLTEVPIMSNQDHAAHHPLERVAPVGHPSCSGSKALNDFDSWLDTL